MFAPFPSTNKRTRGIRRNLRLFTAITLVAMWSLVIGAAISLRGAALEKARGDASNLSAAFAGEVHHVMAYVSGAMNLLEQRLKAEGTNFDLHKWAPAIPEVAAATIQVAIVGPDGKLIATTVDPKAKGLDLSDREHIRVHIDNPSLGIFVGKPVLGRVSHQITIQVTKRLTWADGSFAGVLLFSVDPRLLTSLHQQTDLGRSGVFTLIGDDRVIRARLTKDSGATTDPLVGTAIKASRIFKAAAVADNGTYEGPSVLDHVERVYNWRRVAGFPLIVLVGLGRADALAAADWFVITVIAGAILLTVVLVTTSVNLDRETLRRALREADLASEREKLAASQEHLAQAQRVAGVGSLEVELATDTIRWSDGACGILGVDPKSVEPTGEYYLGFVHPEDRGKVRRMAEEAAASGVTPPPLEYRIVRPDGGVRVIYRENAIRRDAAGKPVSRIVTIKDITEQKATEAELRRTMAHLEHAQRVAQMGSIVRDLATDSAECSAEVYRIFGLDRDSFDPSTESFVNLLLPEDKHKLLDAYNQICAGTDPAPFEYRIQRPDGSIRHIYRETDVIRDESGKAVGFVGILQDVTDVRAAAARQDELERQLQHSQKLEALGTLAGGIAHDINNTLVPIMAISKLVLNEHPTDDPLHEDMSTILRASERARDLVKQILAFSRKRDIMREEVDFAAIVCEALQMLRAGLPATIQIDQQIAAVPPFFGDAGELHQVLVNLVTNAAQAIGARRGLITVRLALESDAVELRIADTGCGMDEAVVQRIFEPFFTTKPVGEGTGLGLSMVHGIVTGHGGRIEVASVPGEGTTFVVRFPIEEPVPLALTSVAA